MALAALFFALSHWEGLSEAREMESVSGAVATGSASGDDQNGPWGDPAATAPGTDLLVTDHFDRHNGEIVVQRIACRKFAHVRN